jgi:2-phosphosulfolactate phosphatase
LPPQTLGWYFVMAHVLNVYALPKLADPAQVAGGAAVVIDVLRATTTIAYALEAGAAEVLPCQEVDEARLAAGRFSPGQCLLGGERHGLAIEGFDLGNSPSEYTPERVGGKTVVFTTTNGTRAMFHARPARRILIAGFVNVSAVVRQLIGEEQVYIVCAGTEGEFSRDDVLLAGMIVELLTRRGGMNYQQNAQAITAREVWMNAFAVPQALGAEPIEPERLAEELYTSPGGRNLANLGLDEDILAAAQIDRFEHACQLDPPVPRIRLET